MVSDHGASKIQLVRREKQNAKATVSGRIAAASANRLRRDAESWPGQPGCAAKSECSPQWGLSPCGNLRPWPVGGESYEFGVALSCGSGSAGHDGRHPV